MKFNWPIKLVTVIIATILILSIGSIIYRQYSGNRERMMEERMASLEQMIISVNQEIIDLHQEVKALKVGMPQRYAIDELTQREYRSHTLADMRAIGTALGSYQVDTNIFPIGSNTTFGRIAFKRNISDGLTTEYYEGASKDGWGNDFYYSSNGLEYTLKSFGKDWQAGFTGNEFDSDIVYINGIFRAPSAIVNW